MPLKTNCCCPDDNPCECYYGTPYEDFDKPAKVKKLTVNVEGIPDILEFDFETVSCSTSVCPFFEDWCSPSIYPCDDGRIVGNCPASYIFSKSTMGYNVKFEGLGQLNGTWEYTPTGVYDEDECGPKTEFVELEYKLITITETFTRARESDVSYYDCSSASIDICHPTYEAPDFNQSYTLQYCYPVLTPLNFLLHNYWPVIDYDYCEASYSNVVGSILGALVECGRTPPYYRCNWAQLIFSSENNCFPVNYRKWWYEDLCNNELPILYNRFRQVSRPALFFPCCPKLELDNDWLFLFGTRLCDEGEEEIGLYPECCKDQPAQFYDCEIPDPPSGNMYIFPCCDWSDSVTFDINFCEDSVDVDLDCGPSTFCDRYGCDYSECPSVKTTCNYPSDFSYTVSYQYEYEE